MIEADGGRIKVRAKLWGAKRFASWYMDELCNDPNRARDRLLLGWAIGCMAKHDGFRIRESVGHPGEALRMAAPMLRLADEWEAWALG